MLRRFVDPEAQHAGASVRIHHNDRVRDGPVREGVADDRLGQPERDEGVGLGVAPRDEGADGFHRIEGVGQVARAAPGAASVAEAVAAGGREAVRVWGTAGAWAGGRSIRSR